MSVIVAEMKNAEGFWRILCPKEEKKIPIYQCIGSLIKQNGACASVRSSVVSLDGARVTCLWPEERKELKD